MLDTDIPKESNNISDDQPNPLFQSEDLINDDVEKSNVNEINIPIEDEIVDSCDSDVNSDDSLNVEQEKEVEEELDIDLNIPPFVPEMIEQTSNRSNRLRFLSKLPFFRKSKSTKKSQGHRLKIYQIYRFADKFDILLMIIGTIAAIATGALSTLLLYLYRLMANYLIQLQQLQSNVTSIPTNTTTVGQCVTDSSSNRGNESIEDAISGLIKYYLILGFSGMIFYWIAWSSWSLAAERQVRRIRYHLFRNILRQEMGWFDVHNSGELSSRLIEDLDKIKDGINEKVPDFISLVSRLLGGVIYAFVVGWKLSLVFLSVSPLIILTFHLTVKIIVKYTIKEIQAFASASAVAQEVLQNIRTVTAFHGQVKEEERFAKNLIKAKRIGIKKGLFMGLCQATSQILTFLAFTIIFWYGPQLIRTDCTHYSPGALIVVFVACRVATLSTAQLMPTLQNFAEGLGSGRYVFDIIDRKTKIDAMSDEGDKPSTIIGNIEFDNIMFSYPSREQLLVLNKLSLKISSGQTIALVGASGCGKSTIIQLLQRFYDPEEGRILLDGKDIKTLNVGWLRSNIGIVSQEPVLFQGSIQDNIRFGKFDATDEEIQNAAKMANAHDFIMALPQNYETLSGDKLSGGQKQRVAIARALVSNPKVLLLDEATSALDNTSERVVQDALDKAKEGRTTIIIAHRLSTIRNANLIIGLEDGSVIEYGTHDQLMNTKGLYYQLVTKQTEKERDEEEKEKEKENDSDNEKEKKEEEEEKQIIQTLSVSRRLSRAVIRRLSRQSKLSSLFGDIDDDDDDDTNDPNISDDLSKMKRKGFGIPFVFRILKLNGPEWHWIVLGSICSLVSGAIQPMFALFFSRVYALFAEPDLDEQKRLTSIYAGSIFAIGACGAIVQFVSTVGFAKSGEELTMRIRKLTFSAILRQEMNYFDQQTNTVGALVTRLSSDASSLKGLSGIRIGIILQALGALIAAFVIAFLSSWKLSFIVVCFVPLMIFCGKLEGQHGTKRNKSKSKFSFPEQGGQYATQAIEHIRTVISLHLENHFINLYENVFNQEFKKQMCRLHLMGISTGIANSMIYFLHCASFTYGSKLVEDKEIRFDQVFRVFIVINFAMIPVGRALSMIPDYTKAKNAAIRIFRLNKRQSQINPHDQSGLILKEIKGEIEFQNVNFKYPSRATVRILKDFSLKCSIDSTTALVGPSGSGKSTIMGLLQRFYDPIKGNILIDGYDIRLLNIQWLRSIMSLVQQEPILFNLSIRENIAYGDNTRQVTQQDIETAAKMSNIHDLIISLPQGYETLCGLKGSQLSGGQKQRIAIARALIRSPKILLLDEATSALDSQSEQVIQTALDKAKLNRTCLTIAHRLSTIQKSEKIVVVDRGKIREEGTHDQLLQLNQIYAKLASTEERSN